MDVLLPEAIIRLISICFEVSLPEVCFHDDLYADVCSNIIVIVHIISIDHASMSCLTNCTIGRDTDE